MRGPKLIIGALVIVVVLAGVARLFRDTRYRNRVTDLRDQIHNLRAAADSCQLDVDAHERALLAERARIDSLHGRIRHLESLRPGGLQRGVPADSYPVYMTAFNDYNASAATWAADADTVRAHLERCRATSREHNQAVDSLRRILR